MTESEVILEIVEIINNIKAESRRNIKKKILIDNKENEFLKYILRFIYNPYIVTGISDKKLNKDIKYTINKVSYYITDIYDLMSYLVMNNTGADQDIINLQDYLKHRNNTEFLRALITKNLKIGVTAKTLNAVFGKDFIPCFNVMMAKNLNDHKDKLRNRLFTLTEKLNGIRCIMVKESGVIKCFTRQGHVINGLIEIEKEAINLLNNHVYDGELIAINGNNLNSEDLFRKTDSIARKDGVKIGLIFNVFDCFPVNEFKRGKSIKVYEDRLLNFKDSEFIKKVPVLYSGNDISKIDELLEKVIEQDKEGLILNFNDANYECKRTDAILKVVKYNKADVRVIDVIEGKNKNKGKLGAIVFEFSHKEQIYTSECGSGFSDKERIDYWNNPDIILNKIVTIQYKGISRDKKGKYSIRNSVWLNIIREDKTEISMY